jgi:hypothetical protein
VRAVGRRTVVVNGFLNGLAARTARLVPHAWVAQLSAVMMRPHETTPA